METAEFIAFIVKSSLIFFTCLFVGIFLKKAIRGEPGNKREMERIRQEMAELRDRMDKQYADLTLMLEDVRRGLKHRYEAYQMWLQKDRLRRQDPPPAPQDEEDKDE